MAGRSFNAQVGAWVLQTRARMEAVQKESAKRVFNLAREGTPVDTGFLRASFVTSLSAPITDIRFRPPGDGSYQASDTSIAATIAGAQIGVPIYGVFTANYAVFVEYGARGRPGVGFVRLAAQQWQSIVEAVATELRSRAGG
ncbi:HK97 gp10 family phage protein [Salinarimonas sp. NSM]|uniref:HK97 gp10 family phage protein n=1 Tax=Salinarimonas sp. NSM TaxID=3458003 RepID=UPI0040363992